MHYIYQRDYDNYLDDNGVPATWQYDLRRGTDGWALTMRLGGTVMYSGTHRLGSWALNIEPFRNVLKMQERTRTLHDNEVYEFVLEAQLRRAMNPRLGEWLRKKLHSRAMISECELQAVLDAEQRRTGLAARVMRVLQEEAA